MPNIFLKRVGKPKGDQCLILKDIGLQEIDRLAIVKDNYPVTPSFIDHQYMAHAMAYCQHTFAEQDIWFIVRSTLCKAGYGGHTHRKL